MVDRLKSPVAFLLLTNKAFRVFRWLGVHVTPVHFYSPVPDMRELDERPEIWDRASEMPGVVMDDGLQLRIMEEAFRRYQPECDFPARPAGRPEEFYTQNDYFGYVSATAMHGMVRHFRPRRIVEIGAGHSTRVLARAARMNAAEGFPAEVIAVDPYPGAALRGGLPGLSQLIARKVQEVDIRLFTELEENDLLSIDTSHAVRMAGDVVSIYLEILPRLPPGVLVHVHDVFLPEDYPKAWLERRFFWNEQYLLQAFLAFNHTFEVIWGQKYAERRFPAEFSRAFGGRVGEAENFQSYSFWIRRTAAGTATRAPEPERADAYARA